MRVFFNFAALAAVVLAVGAVAAQAQTPQRFDRLLTATAPAAPPLRCEATKMFSCGAQGCDTEHHPTGLPVTIDLKTAEGKGYLCTYTYCRSFTLMGWRGRPKATGLTWSAAAGSTPPEDKRPTYDFTLSVAEDWRSFTLSSPGNGMVSGYSGACAPP